MIKKWFNVSKWFQGFFFLFNIFIIINYYLRYSTEKQNSNIFIQTNCRINKTFTQQIICPKTKKMIGSNNETKLCPKNFYEIIYDKNSVVLVHQPPIWLAPDDLKKLHKNLETSWGKTIFKSLNIPCYYNSLNHSDIRWTRTDTKGFIHIILFSFFALCFTLLYFFDECYRQRRSNRR